MVSDDINNRHVKRIAEDHCCSVPEVNKALDAHPITTERDTYLRRVLALELVELDELGEVFHEKAIADKDVAAGALLAKIHERRATLLGLNAPAAAAVQIIDAAPPAQTSTERIRAAIDRIRLARPEANGGEAN